MQQSNKVIQASKIAGAMGSSLFFGLPFLAFPAQAQISQTIRPVSCPSIYYEQPYDSTTLVPQGCPPNTRTATELGIRPQPGVVRNPNYPNPAPQNLPDPLPNPGAIPRQPIPDPATGVVPPLPEERSNAIARVMPMNGEVSVRLINNTNTPITFEAISYTNRRSLPGKNTTTLTGLPLPVTVTMVRQDNGLLNVIPVTSEEGMLVLSLEEDPSFDDTQGVIRIQEDGQVFIN